MVKGINGVWEHRLKPGTEGQAVFYSTIKNHRFLRITVLYLQSTPYDTIDALD